jgi:hypothetical protein
VLSVYGRLSWISYCGNQIHHWEAGIGPKPICLTITPVIVWYVEFKLKLPRLHQWLDYSIMLLAFGFTGSHVEVSEWVGHLGLGSASALPLAS